MVAGIDLKVKPGLHGFLGPNGAGKSTTIKMLVGALHITKGKAFIMGNKVGSLKANACIGYISERPVFYHMPLEKFLVYVGRLGGLRRKDAKKQANYLIEWLELEDAMNRDINGFSAGMKQKAAIAQALMHQPQLLIMDEPTANLDPIGRANVIKKIKALNKEKGINIFISSHILGEIEKLVDDISIINRGSLIISDNLKALKKKYSGNHFVLVCENQKKIYSLLQRFSYIQKMWEDDDGIHIQSEEETRLHKDVQKVLYENDSILETFKKIDISLEDVFLKTVEEESDKKSGDKKPVVLEGEIESVGGMPVKEDNTPKKKPEHKPTKKEPEQNFEDPEDDLEAQIAELERKKAELMKRKGLEKGKKAKKRGGD